MLRLFVVGNGKVATCKRSKRFYSKNTSADAPPTGVPLNSPDGPTAEELETLMINTFKDMNFHDQMKHFKQLMIRDLKVLIVGSDTTALTAALAFTKNGIKPEVVQTPLTHLDSTPEMATMIPINGQRILGELLSYDYIRNTGVPIQSYAVTNEAGTLYGSLNYNELATVHGFETVGVSLRALEMSLENLVTADGVKMRKNTSVTKFDQRSKNKVRVEFDIGAPGSQFKEKAEAEYDLVIISDGFLSKPREMAFPKGTVTGSNAIRYDAIVKRPASIPPGLMLDMWGSGKRAGFMSITPKLMYAYGITPLPLAAKAPEFRVKQLDSFVFTDAFKDFSGPWTQVAGAIKEKGQCIMSLSVYTEAKKVTNGRIVLAGNAAHGLGPMLTRGQDIGLGIEDAYFLSQYLSLRTIPIEEGLSLYEKRYQDRVKPIMLQAKRELTAAFTRNDSKFRSMIRNLSLKYLYRSSALTSQENRIIGVDARRAARSAFASKVAQSPELQDFHRDLQFVPTSQRQFAESKIISGESTPPKK